MGIEGLKDGRPAARPRRRATGARGSRARPVRRERTPGETTPCVPPSRTCDPHSRRSRTAAGGVPRSRPSDRASRGGGPSTGPPRPPNATRRGRPWIGGGRRAASFGRATRPDTLVIGDGSGFARSGSGPTFRLLSLRPAGAADLASNSEAVRRRSSPVVAAEGETPPDRCMKCRSLGCRLWSVDPIHPVRWRPDRPSGSMHGVAMVQPVPQPGPTPVLRSVHDIRPQGVALHVSADG